MAVNDRDKGNKSLSSHDAEYKHDMWTPEVLEMVSTCEALEDSEDSRNAGRPCRKRDVTPLAAPAWGHVPSETGILVYQGQFCFLV